MNRFERFFGGSPLFVLFRLLLISLLVGVLLSALGLTPFAILDGLVNLVQRVWSLGFDAIENVIGYIIIGAVVVVPIWLVLRLANSGRR